METTMIRTVLGLLFAFSALAANGQVSFYKVYSGNGYDKGEGVVQLADSSYLVTGSSSSFGDAPSQAFLMHVDKEGNFLWSKAYGGPEFEEGKRVMAVEGYGYYLAGTSSSGPSGDFDAYLLFTNEAGEEQWQVYTDNGGWERVHDAALLADTSIVVVGETSGNSDGSQDIFLARYSKLGALIWSQQVGASGDDVAYALDLMSDSTFLVAGTIYVEDSLKNKAYLAKFNNDGTNAWTETYGAESGDYQFNDAHVIVGGMIMAAGQRMLTGKTDYDSYNACTQLDGTYLYGEEFYQDYSSRYSAFVQYEAAPGDNFFVGSQEIRVNPPTYPDGEDCFISHHNLQFYWAGYGMGYNGNGQDQVNEMAKTRDGYAIAVGFHTMYGYGGGSVFLVKLGSDNSFPTPSATPEIISLVNTEELVALKTLRVFPNPVSTQLNVEVEQQAFGFYLTDAAGKQLLSGKAFGVQTLDFAAQPAGIYLLQITHDSGEQTVVKIVK